MPDTVINLEAQVVETQTEAKRRLIRRLRLNPRSPPPAPFFIFMRYFRTTYYEEDHDFNFNDYTSQGAKRWSKLSEEEKNVYRDIAAELEIEYNNKPHVEPAGFAIVRVEDVVEKQAQGKEEDIILDD